MDHTLIVCAVHMAITLPCLYTVVSRNSITSFGLYCVPFGMPLYCRTKSLSVVPFKRINGTLTNRLND